MRYVSCPMSQKAATLHQFTFTMSICDTQLNNHYTLDINTLYT